jgi:hypothetical protein
VEETHLSAPTVHRFYAGHLVKSSGKKGSKNEIEREKLSNVRLWKMTNWNFLEMSGKVMQEIVDF